MQSTYLSTMLAPRNINPFYLHLLVIFFKMLSHIVLYWSLRAIL